MPADQHGTVLLMILLSLFAIGLMSMVVAQVATTEIAISANITAAESSFRPADGASQVLLRDVMAMTRSLGRFPTDAELDTIAPPTFNHVTLTQFDAFADGAAQDATVVDGLLVGLSAEIQRFRVRATTESPGPPSSNATVEILGEYAAIPVFQFGVLYEGDLDVHPNPAMTIGGRVHSNSNIYLDPNTQVSFDSSITAAGDIYNAHESGSVSGGPVYIMDSTGTYQAMNGLDSDSPNWATDAIARWDGRVRSATIGGERLDLVIEDPTDPRLIIEAGRAADTAAEQAAKIWYDAGLRIVNGRGYDSDGNLVSLTDPVSGESAVRYSTIYDWREGKNMLTVEVDIDKLSRAPGYPANGIVYMGAFQPDGDMPGWPGGGAGVGPAEWSSYPAPWTSSQTEFAFKARHGSSLAGDLTVVTENPMYIQGNYNTVAKKAAAVIADAVTVLSNNWGDTDGDGIFDDDLGYSLAALNDRDAASTTINAAIMTGNVDQDGSYNGGVENLPRLLERWSGDTLSLHGSLAALWESQYAVGVYAMGNIYSAPTRDWTFDTDFLDLNSLPPATPRIYKFTVTGWSHQ